MEISMRSNYWVSNFIKNSKEKDERFAVYLNQTADEAINLAKIWESVARSILENGSADADSNLYWAKLIERPEWTIYSKNIPKSRLERFIEKVSDFSNKSNKNVMEYAICKIGSILQKRVLTKEMVEEELKRIKDTRFFSKTNYSFTRITITDSIEILNKEAEAINSLWMEYRSSIVAKGRQKEPSLISNLCKMLFLKKITQEHQLQEFRERYSNASGLDVSVEFLRSRCVYAVFDMKNRMRGGFVLGKVNPFRTIEVFAGKSNRKRLYDYIEGTSYCELNCLWLSVKYRKGFLCYWFWILFALKVSMQKESMLMYGTVAKSLADIYGYPRKSKLLHTEDLMFNNKLRTHWIFIGARTDFFVGVLETFIYKFKNNGKKPVIYKRVSLPAVAN
jgi:hypothetical protein